MTGLSDVVIGYQRRYIDDVAYCVMSISGNTTTPSTGTYAIVRQVVGSNNVYPMYVFDAATTEKEQFQFISLMNVEGIFSETHPTTGDVTDIYISQNGVQQGDAHRFTVERCMSEYEGLIGIGGIVVGIGILYALFRADLWASDNK